MRKKNASHRIGILYLLTILFGILSVLAFFYPTISDRWNQYVSGLLISRYVSQEQGETDFEKVLVQAGKYNENLFRTGRNHISEYTLRLSQGEDPDYEQQLNVLQNQMMAYLQIEKLELSLPIYHYTSDEVLAKGVGHLYGSSLPVGGENTHCVLTGHSGLMQARLFTDIEKLSVGDLFTICVLGRELQYEVDQIRVVLPNQLEALSIEEGKDYVTLVTCTPYGINTHRLLVRGRRVEETVSQEEQEEC